MTHKDIQEIIDKDGCLYFDASIHSFVFKPTYVDEFTSYGCVYWLDLIKNTSIGAEMFENLREATTEEINKFNVK